MFTVYRVENAYGIGPYQGDDSGICPLDSHSRPTPYADGLPHQIWYKQGRVFGFRSMDSLLDWFDHYDLEILEENGYRVMIYRVQDDYCFIGKRQVCFSKEYAVCMGEAYIPQLV